MSHGDHSSSQLAVAEATPAALPTLPAAAPTALGATPASAVPRVPAAVPVIRWYRCPIAREDMKQVLSRSDLCATLQTFGYLATITATGAATIWASMSHRWWWAALPLLFVHGTCMNFLINAVHELGHETVFTSRRLNRFMAGVFAFPGWINHLHFAESHGRHHRYTLHAPADLEVTLPITVRWSDFWKCAFLNTGWLRWTVQSAVQTARGTLPGDWNKIMFPEEEPEKRRPLMRWARFLIAGHLAVLALSLYMHWWMVPLVVSVAPMFGSWLHWLCNNTQHVGMVEEVPDARLCCRTFLVAAPVQFLYWHMNYHVEHHMFAAVPCYRLGRLNRLMRADCPPAPDGLRATWREIMAIMRLQAEDTSYRQQVPLPASAPPTTIP